MKTFTEFCQLTELSKKKAGDYVTRALSDLDDRETEIAARQQDHKKKYGVTPIHPKHKNSGTSASDNPWSKDNKRKLKNRDQGIDRAMKKVREEEEVDGEEIIELSKKTLGDYVKKASKSAAAHAMGSMRAKANRSVTDAHQASYNKGDMNQMLKRLKGIDKATNKLTKEEVEQVDELSKKTLTSYVKKSAFDMAAHGIAQGSKASTRIVKRGKGINRAADRLGNSSYGNIPKSHMKRHQAFLKASKNGDGFVNHPKGSSDKDISKHHKKMADYHDLKVHHVNKGNNEYGKDNNSKTHLELRARHESELSKAQRRMWQSEGINRAADRLGNKNEGVDPFVHPPEGSTRHEREAHFKKHIEKAHASKNSKLVARYKKAASDVYTTSEPFYSKKGKKY